MEEFIYSVQNIFNNQTAEGCLFQYEANNFHIPAYQRGYKWGSQNENDPVPILLEDLKNAFVNSPQKNYYLQYITVSKKNDYLEVIDGQQRLTTISIILSIFNIYYDGIERIADHKLDYAIRPAIFEEHIYPTNKLQEFLNKEWTEDGIQLNDTLENSQDLYYLFSGAKKIYNFLEDLNSEESEIDLSAFHDFFLENVLIIVNSVEPHIPSEKVFRNLNSNKVPLTEVDLIKGLLLTRVARLDDFEKKHFREILEIRNAIGRKWDEIASGCNEPHFSSFFFEEGTGLEGLLTLVAVINGYEYSGYYSNHFPLFNFFNKNSSQSLKFFNEVNETYNILFDWYTTNDLYNLLGYNLVKKKYLQDKIPILKDNLYKSKSEIKTLLLNYRKETLPEYIDNLTYGNGNPEILAVLLAINVFPNGVNNYRFDYYTYKKEEWSIEHIFPQSPEGKSNVLNDNQKKIIIAMLNGLKKYPELRNIINKPLRDYEEKTLYYNQLKTLGKIDSIGNLALISKSINSSLGCGFFDEKREKILTHLQSGKFVPVHTISIFNKSIFNSDPGQLIAWDKKNIEEHKNILQGLITSLRKEDVES
jgi:hypothetical protein